MNKRIIAMYTVMLTLMVMFSICTSSSHARDSIDGTRTLTKSQQYYADTIANIAIENYDEYGVLPSVCVAQAFLESTLGDHCSGYNLWGIKSGAESYNSLEEGCLRYLQVINNGYYEGAPFNKSYEDSIKIIINGGYCVGNNKYISNAIWSIEAYGFDRYDKKLFNKKEKEEELKAREESCKEGDYIIEYSEDVPYHEIGISYEYSHKNGTILLYEDMEMINIKETMPIKGIGNEKVLYSSDPELIGRRVTIESIENSKG